LYNVFDSGSCSRDHFYIPHTPLKTDEKCRQKAELGFAECNFQNLDKKYLAYGVRTKRLFLPSKEAKMNFTQSTGFAEGLLFIQSLHLNLSLEIH
jgi:hypothetical protein